MNNNNVVVSLQGLAQFNPKTRKYVVRIGSLNFPFRNAEEVFQYFLGRLKQRQKFKRNPDTVSNASFFVILTKFILYLTSYCKKIPNHFNRFRGELP